MANNIDIGCEGNSFALLIFNPSEYEIQSHVVANGWQRGFNLLDGEEYRLVGQVYGNYYSSNSPLLFNGQNFPQSMWSTNYSDNLAQGINVSNAWIFNFPFLWENNKITNLIDGSDFTGYPEQIGGITPDLSIVFSYIVGMNIHYVLYHKLGGGVTFIVLLFLLPVYIKEQ